MNKLFSIILFFLSIQIFSQNVLIKYKVHKTNNLNLTKELTNLIKNDNDYMDYDLFFNGEEGKFVPVYKLNNSQTKEIDLNNIFKKTQGEFYFNNKTKVVENKKETLGSKFIISYPYEQIKWTITNETENVLGYFCKKAIYKKEEYGLKETKTYTITVWFTEDYPYQIAPFGLMGLNGLVVKANFNNSFEVEIEKIEDYKNEKITPFEGKNKISMNEFDDVLKSKIQEYRKKKGINLE